MIFQFSFQTIKARLKQFLTIYQKRLSYYSLILVNNTSTQLCTIQRQFFSQTGQSRHKGWRQCIQIKRLHFFCINNYQTTQLIRSELKRYYVMTEEKGATKKITLKLTQNSPLEYDYLNQQCTYQLLIIGVVMIIGINNVRISYLLLVQSVGETGVKLNLGVQGQQVTLIGNKQQLYVIPRCVGATISTVLKTNQ
eukprot:TRINITY_DN10210_c1_g1_i1.p1 TRINITY_DN10210_c1_g1~~TRINITY_DN10210_c1_g1_i1.p1  ORF type:complete len:195 (-),score=-9.58 TRINITY_DN10210_c1_g1_i1:20-604(-)